MADPRRVYFVTEFQRDTKGELIVCIATENEKDFNLTNWTWDCDLKAGEALCKEMNMKRFGISDREANMIIATTMRK